MNCETCGKPPQIPREAFTRWFMQRPPEKFVPLREFLTDYCICEVTPDGNSD